VVVLQGRVELVGPRDPAASDDQHDLFAGFPEGRHHLLAILTQLLRIKVWHDFIEDLGGPIRDGANDAEQHPTGDAAPGAILPPRLAFAGLLTCDLALAQRAGGEASALGCAPPAGPGEGKAPEDRVVCIEPNDLVPARSVLAGSACERAVGKVCGVGLTTPGGAVVASFFVFTTPRTLSRPRWTPVSRAKTVASSRQLPWAWREPCSRGS